jgi:hypothetical protein
MNVVKLTTFEVEFLFFVAVVNLVTCLKRVKWAGWLFINVFAVFVDILSKDMLPEGRKNVLETNRKI